MATNVTLPDFNVTPNLTIDGYYSGFRYKTGEYTVSGDGFKDVVIEYDSTSSKGTSVTDNNYKLNNTTNLVGVKYTSKSGQLPAFDLNKFKGLSDAYCEAGTFNKGGDPVASLTAGTYYIWFNSTDNTLYYSTSKPSSYSSTGTKIKSYSYPIGYSPRCVKFRVGICGGGGGGAAGWTRFAAHGGGSGGGGACALTCLTLYAISCNEATKDDFYYTIISVGSGGASKSGSSHPTNHGSAGGGSSIGWGTPSGKLGTYGTCGGGGGGTAGGSGGSPGGWAGGGETDYLNNMFPFNIGAWNDDVGTLNFGAYGGNEDESGDGVSWVPKKPIDIAYQWNTSSKITKSGGSTPGLGGGGGASVFGSGGAGGTSTKGSAVSGGYGAGGGGGSYSGYNSWGGASGGSGICYIWV